MSVLCYCVHLSSGVREVAYPLASDPKGVHPTPQQRYPAFVDLMCRSTMTVTHSGRIQEEAALLGKPVLVTREPTERPEMLRTGLVHIVGNSREATRNQIASYLNSGACRPCIDNPCGDGRAASRVGDFLEERLLTKEDHCPVAGS